jgi:NAD(P)H-dependent FMN reductase
MKIIGFSSGGLGRTGNTDRMVQAILEKSGHEFEFNKLTDLNFSGCKGCSRLCAGPQVCRMEDEAAPYYQKIKDADAVVLGSPVYGGSINGIAYSFIERFFGYRHVTLAIKDKPVIPVLCGFMNVDAALEQLQRRLKFYGLQVLDAVKFISSMPPCLSCGRHQECRIGGLYRIKGEDALTLTISPDVWRRWEDDPETTAAVDKAASRLKAL